MQSLPGDSFATRDFWRARFGSARAPLLAAAATAVLAITAATALPSASPPGRAAAAAIAASPALSKETSGEAAPAADPHARRFTGRVGPDLSRALGAAGVPPSQGREYVALLGRAIQLSGGLSVDDRFDIVLERKPDGSLGPLLYAGLDRVARADVELLKWTDGKAIVWVNADGVGGENASGLQMPVHGHLTSGFGERFHPILGYERFHAGVDLGAVSGTPIAAAADGRVVTSGWHGGYGNEVAIAHDGGLETIYGHMSRIAAHAGETVRRGEVIGYVGSTGLSTGPHLHFEVTKNGRPIDPLTAKFTSGPAQMQGEKLQAFHDELRQLLLVGAG